MFGRVFRVLALINSKLDALLQKVDQIMTVEQDLQTALDSEKADLDAMAAALPQIASVTATQQSTIDALNRRIAELVAGQPVTQLQLDNLVGESNTLKVQSDGIVTALQALIPTATPPTPSLYQKGHSEKSGGHSKRRDRP